MGRGYVHYTMLLTDRTTPVEIKKNNEGYCETLTRRFGEQDVPGKRDRRLCSQGRRGSGHGRRKTVSPYHTYWKNKKKSWPPKTLVPQNVKGDKRDIRSSSRPPRISSGDHAHFLWISRRDNGNCTNIKKKKQGANHANTNRLVGFLQYNVEENKSSVRVVVNAEVHQQEKYPKRIKDLLIFGSTQDVLKTKKTLHIYGMKVDDDLTDTTQKGTST